MPAPHCHPHAAQTETMYLDMYQEAVAGIFKRLVLVCRRGVCVRVVTLGAEVGAEQADVHCGD